MPGTAGDPPWKDRPGPCASLWSGKIDSKGIKSINAQHVQGQSLLWGKLLCSVFLSLSLPVPSSAGRHTRALPSETNKRSQRKRKTSLASADLSPAFFFLEKPNFRTEKPALAHRMLPSNSLLPGFCCIPEPALKGPPKPGVAQA